jgi:DNA-binding SARP family transcriptional activator/Tfp pilus assembly protein PilF
MAVEFGVLGTVEGRVDGRPLDIGHLRQRCVLAVLLVELNRPVPVDQLLERVWGEHPPQRAGVTLRGYLSRLRQAIAGGSATEEDAAIVRGPGGYVLVADATAVDIHRFRVLSAQARAASDDDCAAELFTRALALWRGEPFGRLDTPWLNAVRESLHRQRRAVMLDRNDRALAGGRHGELLDELVSCAAEHPLDERLAGQLLLALYRCGRQADALGHYRRVRLRLVEDLGTDPSEPLQRMYGRILTADPDLAVAVPACAGTTVTRLGGPQPRQIPAAPHSFTGRARELAELSKTLDEATGRGAAPVISALGGAGGIGKTWLALRWAHDNLERFPDGQLYVNLSGFDPTREPVSPAAAVRGFLEALGVAAATIPADPDAQAALYRTITADRRMLIVLDNARDSTQVIPLLPGSARCAVLVTSRRHLTALVSAHGARPLTLDVLSRSEACQLLTDRLGTDRIAAEPDAVTALLDRCAGLPLALGIIAARAAIHPEIALAGLAADLGETTTRLDALDAGELAVNLRAVFSCSRDALPAPAAEAFGLLSLAPGPDIALPAAASLIGVPAMRVRAQLRDLTGAHMLHEHVPDRYRMHDLVRLYGTEQVHLGTTGSDRMAAECRVLDHYLHSAHAAATVLHAHRDPITLPPAHPGVAPERLASPDEALAWFTAEYPALLGAIDRAAELGFDQYTWQLAWTLTTFLDRQGRWNDWVATQRAALLAAGRLGDRPGQAQSHRRLVRAHTQLADYASADAHARAALDLDRALDDRTGQAHTHLNIAWLLDRKGGHREALDHTRRALDLYRGTGNRAGQANALNGVGWCQVQLGDYQQALESCGQALTLHREVGHRAGEANTWESLGCAQHRIGSHRQALASFRRALELYRHLGDRYQQAEMLIHLGDTHDAAGEPGPATHAWRDALTLLDQLGHPGAGQIRAKLRHVPRPRLSRIGEPALRRGA